MSKAASMPQAQTVSINKMRADAVLVTRGFLNVVILPAFYLAWLIQPMVRDLPRVDLWPLRSPLMWLLVALIIAGSFGFAASYGTPRITAPRLWILVIGGSLTAIGAAAWFVVAVKVMPFTRLEQAPAGVSLAFAAALTVIGLLYLLSLYWMLVSPTMAAMRLFGMRVPPDGTPLPTVLAYPRPQKNAGDAAAAFKKENPVAVAYAVAAIALGFVEAVLVLRLIAIALMPFVGFVFGVQNHNTYVPTMPEAPSVHYGQMYLFAALVAANGLLIRVLWRRARKHTAINADAALQNDPRRPILYLRSFQDDRRTMSTEWDLVMRTRYGRAGRWQGRTTQLIAAMTVGGGGGRIEEHLAHVVAPIGPFIAIGAPDEPLPQIGAARDYFTDDTWQRGVINWVDMAQLIVKVVGPTHWIRWELDTVVNRNAWPKLLILMPPSTPEDHSARWGNIVAALKDRPWGDALAGLDPSEVVAFRLLDEGGLSVVTSSRRRTVDYVLAMRIMLYQMQTEIPTG
jgi:hypothetical protein